jgi:hypothetical protein
VRHWLRHSPDLALAVFRAVAQLRNVRPRERAMKKRTFLVTAIILGALAVVLHSTGYSQMAQATSRFAHGIEQAYRQHTEYVQDAETVQLRQTAHILNTVGLVFTLSCVAALVVAIARRESGWYSIPIMLLFFDVMVMMLS